MVSDEFPLIPEVLLKALETAFPPDDALPKPSTTEREDLFRAGQCDVVRFLRHKLELQQRQGSILGERHVQHVHQHPAT